MKVGLVGATNVGKSTLFNRLIGTHRAIVTEVHWTTRDILYETVTLSCGTVVFLDSPGLDTFDKEIPYLERVILESDLIFFLIDFHAWFGAKEQDIFSLLVKHHKRDSTFLLVNKMDKSMQQKTFSTDLALYYGYGFQYVYPVAAKQGLWIDVIREHLVTFYEANFSGEDSVATDDPIIPLAIVGKPNAGKSTFLNTLLDKQFAQVSDIPGTTLDYNVADIIFKWVSYRFFDTAGIRKRWKIHWLEKIAYDKTLSMLRYTRPLVLFLIDAEQGITHRDTTLLWDIIQMALPVIVVLNKIDLLSDSSQKERLQQIEVFLQFAKHIPICSMSAKNGLWFDTLFEYVGRVWNAYDQHVSAADLHKCVKKALIQRPPRFLKNRECKIAHIVQVESKPPTFMVFVNDTKRANFSFKRRLENTLRHHYGFVWVNLRIFWRNKNSKTNDVKVPIE